MSHASHGRRLRSASKHESCSITKRRSDVYASSGVQIIPSGSSRLPGLKASELALLRQKQRKLAANAPTTIASLQSSSPQLRTALEASLIFAQCEAGSAVCVDPAGWVLTCAHCFGDTEEEYCHSPKKRWLLFYDGRAVQVECRAWDLTRDLALLRIVTLENTGADAVPLLFPFVRLAACAPPKGTRIVCIGQPGQDDLESASARRTKYNLVEVSEGAVCGMVRGADPQDNSEIGTLMHDAWTYWGHSGAPLIHVGEGTLVGLHSSWDDRTAMRHGVPHAAVRVFLAIHLDADE